MDVEVAADAWVDGWRRAWPTRDVDGIASLYSDDAVYASQPFRAPDKARSYAERAFGEEDLVLASFGKPVVSGDRAAVEYWAVLGTPDGHDVTIAGAAFLHFASDGRVVNQRDYWAQTDGAREPPAGWGA